MNREQCPLGSKCPAEQFIHETAQAIITKGSGRVPDEECFWLVERNVSPPQYVSTNSAGWHSDPWQAVRFKTARAAHDYWRLMGESDRPQFKVIEHMFLNKRTS